MGRTAQSRLLVADTAQSRSAQGRSAQWRVCAGGVALTISGRAMAMTLRLTDDEQEALRRRAATDGISMQEAARRAVRAYIGIEEHRERVFTAARRVLQAHADAIERLGQ